MEIGYNVGDEVICIDDSPQSLDGAKYIFKGQKYKVRWIGMAFHPRFGEQLCTRVEGIARLLEADRGLTLAGEPVTPQIIEVIKELFPELADMPFRANRFRPLTKEEKEASWTQEAPIDSEKWDNRRKIKETV